MMPPAPAIPLNPVYEIPASAPPYKPSLLPVFTAAGALAVIGLAAGWATIEILPLWGAGFSFYRWMERRMSPDDKHGLIWMYAGRSFIVWLIVLLTAILCQPGVYQWLGLARWLPLIPVTQGGYAPPLVLIFFVLPLFTIIESNSDVAYGLAILLCAGGGLVCAIALNAIPWPAAFGIASVIAFVGTLLRHFYVSLLARAVSVNLGLKALNDPLPNQENDFFQTITQVLSGLEPPTTPGPTLVLHVPAQSRWRWFNSATGTFEWRETTPALESVLQERRPQWAEQSVPHQSLSRKMQSTATQHTFTNPTAREGVLIPIPTGLLPDGSRPRLRGVLEVPVDRQRNLLVSIFWARWRALQFPFNFRPMQMYGPYLGSQLLGLMTPQQWVRRMEIQVTPFVQPFDRLLDAWRQVKARQCLEDCIEAIRAINEIKQDVSQVASALEAYFDSPCLIWQLTSNNQWHLLGHSRLGITGLPFDEITPPLNPNQSPLSWREQLENRIMIHELTATDTHTPTNYKHLVVALGSHTEAVIGLGILGSRQPVLKQREERLLLLVVSQLALAYSNIRYRDKFKEMANIVTEVSQLISELTRRNGSGAAVQGMHRAVAQRARHLLDADSVVLYGLDPEKQKVVTVWTAGELKDLPSVRDLPLHADSIVYKVARLPAGQLYPNTLDHFYGTRRIDANGQPVFPVRENIISTFTAPLIFEEKVIGVLFANYHHPQTEDSRPKDVYELFVSLATHMLAISGYHQEWAFRAAENDRRRLRRRIHNGLKWEAHTIWLDLAGITPGMVQSHSPKWANVKRSLKRAHDAARRIFDQSEQLLDLLDHAGWTDLQTKGLNTLLRDQAAFIIGDERLFSFQTSYPDRFLDIFDEKDILDFGLEATSNARSYAAGRKVALRLEKLEDTIILVVEDEGPGLPEDKLKKLLASANSFVTLRETARGTLKVSLRSGGGLVVAMSRARNRTD